MAYGVTIVIPTYGRDEVLLATLQHLFAADPPASEIIVVDQSQQHSQEVTCTLSAWHSSGLVRWLCLREPSIPGAMNRGLIEASHPIVLFLDDDIVPHPKIVEAHANALFNHGTRMKMFWTPTNFTSPLRGQRGSQNSWVVTFRCNGIPLCASGDLTNNSCA
jgi:glycosyltransferase involved in cell wall biosynthesis